MKSQVNAVALKQIGTVTTKHGFCVELTDQYAAGLTGFEGFTHVTVLWYADQAPVWQNEMLVMSSPYRGAPEKMGVFATRSPFRPNGICFSTANVISVDVARGIINLEWIDAENGTPVLDVKPYHPSEDRAVSAVIPAWGITWPKNIEESGNFDWENVFLF